MCQVFTLSCFLFQISLFSSFLTVSSDVTTQSTSTSQRQRHRERLRHERRRCRSNNTTASMTSQSTSQRECRRQHRRHNRKHDDVTDTSLHHEVNTDSNHNNAPDYNQWPFNVRDGTWTGSECDEPKTAICEKSIWSVFYLNVHVMYFCSMIVYMCTCICLLGYCADVTCGGSAPCTTRNGFAKCQCDASQSEVGRFCTQGLNITNF